MGVVRPGKSFHFCGVFIQPEATLCFPSSIRQIAWGTIEVIEGSTLSPFPFGDWYFQRAVSLLFTCHHRGGCLGNGYGPRGFFCLGLPGNHRAYNEGSSPLSCRLLYLVAKTKDFQLTTGPNKRCRRFAGSQNVPHPTRRGMPSPPSGPQHEPLIPQASTRCQGSCHAVVTCRCPPPPVADVRSTSSTSLDSAARAQHHHQRNGQHRSIRCREQAPTPHARPIGKTQLPSVTYAAKPPQYFGPRRSCLFGMSVTNRREGASHHSRIHGNSKLTSRTLVPVTAAVNPGPVPRDPNPLAVVWGRKLCKPWKLRLVLGGGTPLPLPPLPLPPPVRPPERPAAPDWRARAARLRLHSASYPSRNNTTATK